MIHDDYMNPTCQIFNSNIVLKNGNVHVAMLKSFNFNSFETASINVSLCKYVVCGETLGSLIYFNELR